MTKLKAALIHLALSIIIVGALSIIIFYVWYPKPLATIAGVIEPIKLLIMIDVIMGPLLTFVVYKKNKNSLKFDLSVIALFQLAALLYGSYTIYQGRSSLVVMYNGKFHYMIEKFGKNDELKYDALKPHLFSTPKMGFISHLPSIGLYNSYSAIEPITDYELMVLPHSLTVENMKAKFTKKHEQIDTIMKKYPNGSIVFFELAKDQSTYYVVFSTKQNKIIDQLKF